MISGPDASKSASTDGSGAFSLTGLRPGSFRVRAEGSGHEIVERSVSAAQDVRLDVLLRPGASCVALPAPTSFRASVTGGTHVTFNWNAVTGAKEYIVGVGTYPNARNVIAPNTTQTTYSWRSAPPGLYYARVLARADCPHENESTEITFSVLMPTP